MRCAGLGLRSGLGPDRNHGGADRASMSPLHAGSFPLVCARHRASDPTRRPAGRQGRSSPHGGAWTDTGGRRVRVQRPDDRTADPTPGSSAPAMTQMSRPPPNPSGHNARLDEWVERWTPSPGRQGGTPISSARVTAAAMADEHVMLRHTLAPLRASTVGTVEPERASGRPVSWPGRPTSRPLYRRPPAPSLATAVSPRSSGPPGSPVR